MTLQEALNYIESLEFQANISALSGFRTVLNAFANDETITNLYTLLEDNTGYQSDVFTYIKARIPNYEAGYTHPDDITIAALLYVLERVESIGALESITLHDIADIKEFWWARYMANKILHEHASNLTYTQIVVVRATNLSVNVQLSSKSITYKILDDLSSKITRTQFVVVEAKNLSTSAEFSFNSTESSYQTISA